MPTLLVPPTGGAGSNVVFLGHIFFLSCALILCDFHFSYVFSFFLFNGDVGGWRACFSCFVLSDGERRGILHKRRTETADRVARDQGGQVGKTWLCYSYHKLLPLPGECFVLQFASYFPLVLSLNSVYQGQSQRYIFLITTPTNIFFVRFDLYVIGRNVNQQAGNFTFDYNKNENNKIRQEIVWGFFCSSCYSIWGVCATRRGMFLKAKQATQT